MPGDTEMKQEVQNEGEVMPCDRTQGCARPPNETTTEPVSIANTEGFIYYKLELRPLSSLQCSGWRRTAPSFLGKGFLKEKNLQAEWYMPWCFWIGQGLSQGGQPLKSLTGA